MPNVDKEKLKKALVEMLYLRKQGAGSYLLAGIDNVLDRMYENAPTEHRFFAASKETGQPVSSVHPDLQCLIEEMRRTEFDPEEVHVYSVGEGEHAMRVFEETYLQRITTWREQYV